MGMVRVTQSMLTSRVLNNINRHSRTLLKLQDQLATGQRVNRPSDDPLAARRGMSARSIIADNEQLLTNISNTQPFLQETETAIMNAEESLQRVNELLLQGRTDTNGTTQRNVIALEVNQLLENMMVQGNHFANGRYAFSGTRTMQPPFEATRNANGEITQVDYVGNDSHFQIEISQGVKLDSNITGQDAFAPTDPGTINMFNMLISIRDNLRAGNGAGMDTNLGEIKKVQEQLMISLARVGSVQRRLEGVDVNLRDINTQMNQVLSDNIDADFSEVMINLNAQSNAFQASLNAGARVVQPSLLDYMG